MKKKKLNFENFSKFILNNESLIISNVSKKIIMFLKKKESISLLILSIFHSNSFFSNISLSIIKEIISYKNGNIFEQIPNEYYYNFF